MEVDAPGLAKIAAQLYALLKSDAGLRALQASNAQQASGFDQPGVAGNTGISGNPGTIITGNQLYTVAEQAVQGGATKPSLLVVVFDSNSGSGRYRIDGNAPSPTIGLQVPAGGIVLNIPGADNIKHFQLIAEAGQTLTFARYLFI